ncbi:MAG: hypothetical protein NTY93_00620 [Candidatus Kaiserbacteria bacterium]|nr:hypothetical protein [Candidatus Kaiserbacteria bacterium]
MEHDAWFFVGVFVFIFLIWIIIGGPTHPISFTGPTLSQPSPLGTGTYLQLPQTSFGFGGSAVSLPGSSNGNSSENSGTSVPTFVGGNVFGTPSPYRSIVTMSHYVSGAASANPVDEYIEIAVAYNAGASVDISGWKLSSDATGYTTIIPKGTEIPISGIVNTMQDIVLTPGTRAILISGRSPIGTSFRENKCIGYLSNFQHFSPSLPQNCPTPSSELALSYGADYLRDNTCLDYVSDLPRCKVVLTPPTSISSACKNFLVKYINYNGCVAAHKDDADFENDTWLVYLGHFSSLWRTKNELIKLLDANGKTVDAFSY